MNTTISVKYLFNAMFIGVETKQELVDLANAIGAELKEAVTENMKYIDDRDARTAKIMAEEKGKSAKKAVKTVTAKTTTEEPTPEEPKPAKKVTVKKVEEKKAVKPVKKAVEVEETEEEVVVPVSNSGMTLAAKAFAEALKRRSQKTAAPEIEEEVKEEKPAPKAKKERKLKVAPVMAAAESDPEVEEATEIEDEEMPENAEIFEIETEDGGIIKLMSNYSDKCWVAYGDTKPFKDFIKKECRGGFRSNFRYGIGAGWAIANKFVPKFTKALGVELN